MNIFSFIKERVSEIVKNSFDRSIDTSGVSIELPKDKAHGDFATNAAMVLRNQIGKTPKEIADVLCLELKKLEFVVDCSVAGPGFINLKVRQSLFQELVPQILERGNKFGDSNLGQNSKVNLEFVSVNPTGPLHVGHARGAVYGDALANLLKKTGYDVTKEYYYNDAGGQIDVLTNSVFIRYKQALGHSDQIPEGMYPGEYLVPIGLELKEIYADKLLNMDAVNRQLLVRDFAVGKIMELIVDDLDALGVKHDVFTSERKELHETGLIEKSIKQLEDKGYIYSGVLEPPKGMLPEDWEPREQLLFKSTEFGDDVDRPLKKSDGAYTYFAGDVAYIVHKLNRGFKDMILLIGADHAGYVKRMKAAVKAISNNEAKIDILINQLVNLYQNGQPLKMSKRAGTYVTARDVIDEVGKDILRFVMLARKNDTLFDFDFNKVKEQSKDNPVFYVQYACARSFSVLTKAAEQKVELKDVDFSKLDTIEDLALIQKMAEFPKLVEAAALSHEPHRITFYLNELAQEFHSFWARGNENDSLRFFVDDVQITKARVALAKAVYTTISSGLAILGVKAVEKM